MVPHYLQYEASEPLGQHWAIVRGVPNPPPTSPSPKGTRTRASLLGSPHMLGVGVENVYTVMAGVYTGWWRRGAGFTRRRVTRSSLCSGGAVVVQVVVGLLVFFALCAVLEFVWEAVRHRHDEP